MKIPPLIAVIVHGKMKEKPYIPMENLIAARKSILLKCQFKKLSFFSCLIKVLLDVVTVVINEGVFGLEPMAASGHRRIALFPKF